MSNHERSSGSKEKSPTLQDRLKQLGGRKLLIAAVVAGGLAIGGLAFSNMNKGASTENPQTNQSQSSEQLSPEEERLRKELEAKPKLSLEEIRSQYESKMPKGEQIAEDFKIPAGLNDQEIVNVFADKLTKMMDCGYDPLLYDEYVHQDTSRDTFVDSRLTGIAAACQKYIAPAMFSPEALNTDTVTKFLKSSQDKHAYNLDLRVLTSGNPTENEESYQVSYSPRQVTNVTATGVSPSIRTLSFSLIEKSNVDKNRADEDLGATLDTVGVERKFRVTFTENGSGSKITSLLEF